MTSTYGAVVFSGHSASSLAAGSLVLCSFGNQDDKRIGQDEADAGVNFNADLYTNYYCSRSLLAPHHRKNDRFLVPTRRGLIYDVAAVLMAVRRTQKVQCSKRINEKDDGMEKKTGIL